MMKNRQQPEYDATDIRTLKEQALTKKDVATLRKVKAFENWTTKFKTFYCRENEDIIRDQQGNPVEPQDMPRMEYPVSLSYVDINMGKILPQMPDHPGDALRSVDAHQRGGLGDNFKIFEVPANQKFPIPDNFNWTGMCATQPDRSYPVGHRHRLNKKYNRSER